MLSRIRSLILSWVDSNELAWMPPRLWKGTDAENELWTIRRWARARIRAQLIQNQGFARTCVQTLLWPFWAMFKSGLYVRSYREWSRKRKITTFADSVWLQWVYNIRIGDQIYLRLDLPEHRSQVRGFMVCRELQCVLGELHRRSPGRPELRLKDGFAAFCLEHDLPHPKRFSVGDSQGNVSHFAPWPKADLILKKAQSEKGKDIECLRYCVTADNWLTEDGSSVSAETLVDYTSRHFGQEAWILQERLKNHESWQGFTTGALSTVRIVTMRPSPNAPPVVCFGLFRFALKHPVVDNISAGGVGSMVDISNGRLFAALSWNQEQAIHQRHPQTNHPIDGTLIPEWDVLCKLALQAHEAAEGWTAIGWDLSLTSAGPVLIEANMQWGALTGNNLADSLLPTLYRNIIHPGHLRDESRQN